MASPLEYYNERKQFFQEQLILLDKQAGRVGNGRLLLVVVTIAAVLYLNSSGVPWAWWYLVAPLVGFFFLVNLSLRLTDKIERCKLNINIIDNEVKALGGDFAAFAPGTSYIDTLHPFSYDLDLFGRHSIYQMLCRTVTFGGALSLSEQLSQLTFSADLILQRQAINKELAAMPDFLQSFRVVGMRAKEEDRDQAKLIAWLQSPNVFTTDNFAKMAGVAMPSLTLLSIGYSFFSGGIFIGIYLIIAVNLGILRKYASEIKIAAQQIGNSATLLQKYERLLAEMATNDFKNEALQAMANNARESLAQISAFKKLVKQFDTRSNGMVGPFMNWVFLYDIVNLLRLEAWKFTHHQLLERAIAQIVEMDVYVSYAVYTFNHPTNTYPVIDNRSRISATEAIHPLLATDHAIGNDFSLGIAEQFYLLTGANMTGKSTFIRTVGVCIVCGNIGLPLPVKHISLPLVDLYTSMRVTDSVQDDISYFKAELNRIKSIMTSVKNEGRPFLVLLDEPLRGTNSTDKQEGTRSIVENLLQYHAIGIVATHDTVLCDMEQQFPGKVSNFHFESRVEETGLSFDFKLKPGGSTSNNATILMRQMGILK